MSPTTIIHIITPVIIVHKLVDRLRSIHYLINQRLAQQIFVRSFRTIADCHANATNLSFVNIVRSKKEIIFSIFANHRRSPHRFLSPFNGCSIQNRSMFGPVHKVFGRETIKESLFFVNIAPSWKDPISIIINNAFRIGIPPLEYRITTRGLMGSHFLLLCKAASTAHHQDDANN